MTSATAGAIGRAGGMALAVWILPGCALLPPAKVDMQTFILNPPSQVVGEARVCRPATLLVFPPRAETIYGTTQMAYTARAHQVAYFSRHEWAETPSQMLLPLLVRALYDTQCLEAVVPPSAHRYDGVLRTDLVELLQDFTAQPPVLRLALRVQLSDDASGRVIASKQITLSEPLSERTVDAGVAAANKATATALQEVVMFVLAATSSATSHP